MMPLACRSLAIVATESPWWTVMTSTRPDPPIG